MITITLHCSHCQSDALVRHGHAPNLPARDISTRNWIEACLSGQGRTIVDVDIPAATWDRRHVINGGRHSSISRSIGNHIREWMYHGSLALATAGMNVGCM